MRYILEGFNGLIHMKKLMAFVLFMLMWSGQALAACNANIVASTATADFVVHGNGTVTDNKTGLMWKQCSEGLIGAACTGTQTTHTWQSALQQAGVNNTALFAGFSDWRLPNFKELNSIVEEQCNTPAVNAAIFPATSGLYWSASLDAGSADQAWLVDFTDGGNVVFSKTFASVHVRLVRGGF